MKQWLLICCMALSGLSACKKDSDSSIPVTSSAINVFMAVPDASFDVVLDTVSLGAGLGFGGSTGYHAFRAQRYKLKIYPAGNHTTPVAGGEINLRHNHYYSVFMAIDRDKVLRVVATEDDLTAPPANFSKLRVVNLSNTLTSSNQPLTMDVLVDGVKRFPRVGFMNITPFTQVGIGSRTRDLRRADSEESLLQGNAPDFTAEDRKVYSWILIGDAQTTGFKIIQFEHKKP